MNMYLEQQLRECPSCRRVFAVEYEFPDGSTPAREPSEYRVRSLVCPLPECNHIVPVPLLTNVVRVRTKPTLAPQPLRRALRSLRGRTLRL